MHLHRTLLRKIEKLEKIIRVDDRIPVYVENKEDLDTRIGELIAVGALTEADRPRCVSWLKYRHYNKWRGTWQVTDGPTRRLKAQAAIWTPCATWLTAPQSPTEPATAAPVEQPADGAATTND